MSLLRKAYVILALSNDLPLWIPYVVESSGDWKVGLLNLCCRSLKVFLQRCKLWIWQIGLPVIMLWDILFKQLDLFFQLLDDLFGVFLLDPDVAMYVFQSLHINSSTCLQQKESCVQSVSHTMKLSRGLDFTVMPAVQLLSHEC